MIQPNALTLWRMPWEPVLPGLFIPVRGHCLGWPTSPAWIEEARERQARGLRVVQLQTSAAVDEMGEPRPLVDGPAVLPGLGSRRPSAAMRGVTVQ